MGRRLSGERDTLPRPEVARRAPDRDLVPARDGREAAGLAVPLREGALAEGERELAFGSGAEIDATECPQLAQRAARHLGAYIELDDSSSRPNRCRPHISAD
jgi:hypothetical protein